MEREDGDKEDKSNSAIDADDDMGSSTIKTAKTMQESNTLRKIMYTSAKKTAILNILTIICCIIDSEIRWNNRNRYDDWDYVQYEHYSFYLTNTLRCISFVAALVCVRYTITWYHANIKKLKQRNKIS